MWHRWQQTVSEFRPQLYRAYMRRCMVGVSRTARLWKPSLEWDGWQDPTVQISVSVRVVSAEPHVKLDMVILSPSLCELGKRACTYDIVDSDEENIATTQGFLKLLKQCLRIREGGLFYLGHPCSMMIWVSQSLHRRCVGSPWGDEAQERSLEANHDRNS